MDHNEPGRGIRQICIENCGAPVQVCLGLVLRRQETKYFASHGFAGGAR